MTEKQPYLRNLKKTALISVYHNGFIEKNTVHATLYRNAYLLPAKGKDLLFGVGGVVVDGTFVEASGVEDRFGGFYEPGELDSEEKKIVYCGLLVNHWGHFLIESVARLWYYLEHDNDTISEYVFVSTLNGNTELKGNYKEFFDLLGITDRLRIINKPVRFSQVIVPELAYNRMKDYYNGFLTIYNTIRERALCQVYDNEWPQKLFFSRSKIAMKSDSGLEMMDNFFSNNGFRVLYPEQISLGLLINYMENAEIIAAESGTLPHNLLFAHENKKVIIINRSPEVNEVQVDIDRMKELDTVYIDGHYSIYPGAGVYYIAFNKWMRCFAKDYNMTWPDQEWISEKYKKTCLRKYMKNYFSNYQYRLCMGEWQCQFIYLYYEAYEDTFEDLKEYLTKEKAFHFWGYLDPFYVKSKLSKVKRFLKG